MTDNIIRSHRSINRLWCRVHNRLKAPRTKRPRNSYVFFAAFFYCPILPLSPPFHYSLFYGTRCLALFISLCYPLPFLLPLSFNARVTLPSDRVRRIPLRRLFEPSRAGGSPFVGHVQHADIDPPRKQVLRRTHCRRRSGLTTQTIVWVRG